MEEKLEIELTDFLSKKIIEQNDLLKIYRVLNETSLNEVTMFASFMYTGINAGLLYENKFIHFDGFHFTYYDEYKCKKFNPAISLIEHDSNWYMEKWFKDGERVEWCSDPYKHKFYYKQIIKDEETKQQLLDNLKQEILDCIEAINYVIRMTIKGVD